MRSICKLGLPLDVRPQQMESDYEIDEENESWQPKSYDTVPSEWPAVEEKYKRYRQLKQKHPQTEVSRPARKNSILTCIDEGSDSLGEHDWNEQTQCADKLQPRGIIHKIRYCPKTFRPIGND